MPLQPLLSQERTARLDRKLPVVTSFSRKKNLETNYFQSDKRDFISSKSTLARPLGVSLRGGDEDEARRKGRAIQLGVLQQPKPAARTGFGASGKLLSSLSNAHCSNTAKAPTGQNKTFTVTSASTAKVRPLSSPHEEGEPPSMFDDAPVQTCLEYLTRPHRSWESAVRLRELGSRKLELWKRRVAKSCCSSSTAASSARLSSASLSRNTSASGFTVHTAPTRIGGFSAVNSRGGSGGGSLLRGRFGVLPRITPECEGLMVAGSHLAQLGGQPAPSQRSSSVATNSCARSNLEKRGITAPTLRRICDFGFKMQQ